MTAAVATSHLVHNGSHRPSGKVARNASEATPASELQKVNSDVGVIEPRSAARSNEPGSKVQGREEAGPQCGQGDRGQWRSIGGAALRDQQRRQAHEYGDSDDVKDALGDSERRKLEEHRQFALHVAVHGSGALGKQPTGRVAEQQSHRGNRRHGQQRHDQGADPAWQQRRPRGERGHSPDPHRGEGGQLVRG